MDHGANIFPLSDGTFCEYCDQLARMSEWERPKVDLGHPDSAIRLASAVHRFRMPKPNPDRKLSFARSFRTAGSTEKTRRAILKADELRKKLTEAVSAGKVSHERVVADARRYQPLIHQILVSCKFQPEMARLDGKLEYERRYVSYASCEFIHWSSFCYCPFDFFLQNA